MKFAKQYSDDGAGASATMMHPFRLWPTLVRLVRNSFIKSQIRSDDKVRQVSVLLCAFVSLWFSTAAQRTEISLNSGWLTRATDSLQEGIAAFEKTGSDEKGHWKSVSVPHNWDAYEGYRRKLHGNRHGYAYYSKTFRLQPQPKSKRVFLFFEGVGSYATVWLNGRQVAYHAGGRTTFTIDITNVVVFNKANQLFVRADHPAGIKDLPWVCGGCSDERGFSEGSQPMGIFRPVSLIITNDVRIQPFGVQVWNDANANEKSAQVFTNTEVNNYGSTTKSIIVINRLVDKSGRTISEIKSLQNIAANAVTMIKQQPPVINNPTLWSLESPYCYTIITEVFEGTKLLDRITTPYGIRTISWPIGKPKSSNQFLLNGKPVFINGIAEYEHLLGASHAFSEEQIRSRVQQMKAAGFNAFRDAHHPHNLRYQQYWDSLGVLWWTQMGAHVWYDTPQFCENFKTTLKEWVKERRNSPSLVLWGLQNESKLPEDFARECTEIIRSMDPTASSQRLVTTCNGGSGTDWDVPQNWTGTYGGNPLTYGDDVKRQILIGEYGAWRTLDLHTEGGFVQNGPHSEDRFVNLMETKIRLAEAAKDSTAGHFMWLWTSHDNPGRVQGGEGYREMDRIGPVNYKGLLTPWEEPTDAFYLYRSNYADKHKEPMVYIASHTWPDRWTTPSKKNGIAVYSNCDEVELFNDVRSASLGRKKRGSIGTHFTWNGVDVRYNILYAVAYVNGKEVATDVIVLHHLPQAPSFKKLYTETKNILLPQPGYKYLYRVNCGGSAYTDSLGQEWMADREQRVAYTWGSSSWTKAFDGMPPYFASQRKTTDPLRGTKDWPLFQDFRYGREELKYHFPVQDGEYLVELYFTEPWLGTGGGMNCSGWRLFDVAIDGKTVLKDLDIWKEAGHDGALKKTVKVSVNEGLLTISFPRVAAGQAVISAIAIATKNKEVFAFSSPDALFSFPYDTTSGAVLNDWLATGDKTFSASENSIRFNALPSEVAGAQWSPCCKDSHSPAIKLNREADVYLAADTAATAMMMASGFNKLLQPLQLSDGTMYAVFKKRMEKDNLLIQEAKLATVVMVQPASNIEPAYDLKTVMSYKAINAVLQGSLIKGKVDGKDRVIVEKAADENRIEWTFNVGVADVYSLTVSYNNATQQVMNGKLQLLSADGTMMKEEAVEFTPTKQGKSNYIVTNTGSMVNAGAYKLRLSVEHGVGLSLNALDVQ